MAAKTGLTHDAVLGVAESLVDRDGWQRLSVSALARELSVRGPSIHHHVGSLEALLAEVQIRAKADLSERIQRAGVGKVASDGIRSLAAALLGFARAHPGLYELSQSRSIEPEQCMLAAEPSRAALTAVIESFGIPAPPVELLLTCFTTLHGVLDLAHAGTMAREELDAVYRQATELVVLLLEDASQS